MDESSEMGGFKKNFFRILLRIILITYLSIAVLDKKARVEFEFYAEKDKVEKFFEQHWRNFMK